MLASILSCALVGIEGWIVEVEVDISNGLPSFSLVGLPDIAVKAVSYTHLDVYKRQELLAPCVKEK